ncbi:hypothetical protein NW754_009533 [Fusarium falciforme]|nr:hypothetical protein NW754_009533 [Fusarium falciforme]
MSDTTFNRRDFADKLSGHIIELAYRNPDGSLRTDVLPVSENPPVHSGGAGLFSTAADYSAFLQAVLAAGEGQTTILRKDTVDEMFRPQLDGAAKRALQTVLTGNLPFPVTEDFNHGLSGVINTVDVDGRRREGTLTWGGMSSSQWAGIAAVLFVNLMGAGDDVIPKLYRELEEAVYLAISQDSQNQP